MNKKIFIIISVLLSVAIIFSVYNAVFATGISIPSTIVNNTPTENNTTNTVNVVNNTTPANVTNIVTNNTKQELSQTGEYDTYIIIGAFALVTIIGLTSFIKVKALDK